MPYLRFLRSLLFKKYGVNLFFAPQDPVYGAHRRNFNQILPKFSDLLITPAYNTGYTFNTLYEKIKRKSILVHWPSEQLIDSRFYKEKLNLDNKDNYKNEVDYHLVWGIDFANILMSYTGVDADKIYIVGCPKLVLDVSLRNKKVSKTVLLVSDFNVACFNDKTIREHRKYKIDGLERIVQFYKDAKLAYIDQVSKIIISNPDYEFALRLHPGESDCGWESILKFDNVYLDKSASFAEALNSKCLVIQFLSTSIFETVSRNIPVVALRLFEHLGENWRDYYKCYPFVDLKAQRELVYVDKLIDYAGQFDVMQNVDELFSVSQGNALERTAYAIYDIVQHGYRSKYGVHQLQKYLRFKIIDALKDRIYVNYVEKVLDSIGLRLKKISSNWERSDGFFDVSENKLQYFYEHDKKYIYKEMTNWGWMVKIENSSFEDRK
jgi:hypothetical protein